MRVSRGARGASARTRASPTTSGSLSRRRRARARFRRARCLAEQCRELARKTCAKKPAPPATQDTTATVRLFGLLPNLPLVTARRTIAPSTAHPATLSAFPSARLEQDEAEAASTGLIKTPAPTDRPLEPSPKPCVTGTATAKQARASDANATRAKGQRCGSGARREAAPRQPAPALTHRDGHFCARLDDSLCARGGLPVARQTPAAMVPKRLETMST